MTPEHLSSPQPRKPYEMFGFTKEENSNWRIGKQRFEGILNDDQTIVHTIRESSNTFGEFLFITTSRPGDHGRVAITFYGQGFHENRERWITDEWFWYQTTLAPDQLQGQIDKEETKKVIQQHMEKIEPNIHKPTQSDRGKVFEMLADLTDEDGALAEMEDLESLNDWLFDVDEQIPPEEPPDMLLDLSPGESPSTGENLLDIASREKLPPLHSGEEKGLAALAQVKFFTPDSNWTWYASEFDGEDIFFGLVSGFEVEFGYFSLKELQEILGPFGLLIERDLHFEPKKLGELMEYHWQQRNQRS